MNQLVDQSLSGGLRKLTGWKGSGLVMLGVTAGFGTFAILTGLTPITPTDNIARFLLICNAVLLTLMVVVIGGQIVFLIREWRKKTPGAGLHLRLVALFSLIAMIPALAVALFATVTLNRGLDVWFSERTRNIVDGAIIVAQAYVQEHAEILRADTIGIAANLASQRNLFDNNLNEFTNRLATMARFRGLAAAFVFDQNSNSVVVSALASETIEFIEPPSQAIEQLNAGELVLIPLEVNGNIVRGLIKLQNFPNHYLYLYREVNPWVTNQLEKSQAAKKEYDDFLARRSLVQITFAMMYAVVTFVLLLAAIWVGLWFSDRLVAPVVRLLDASRRVSQGDFGVKIKNFHNSPGDLVTVSQTFNLMTERIKRQHDELHWINASLDERRRFIETMLAGVTAGVVGVNPMGQISLVNRSALLLLGEKEENLIGREVEIALPQFRPLFVQALLRSSGFSESKIDILGKNGERSFFARFTTEISEGTEHSHVLTFDDITDLVTAQRNSAWSDIARRIAHEIKNPLTPIQLAAERLKRKYSKQIQTDRKIFEQCTETIIRQVSDIGRMVDEFSSFARMPKAVLKPQNLADVVREATVLQRVSSGDTKIMLNVDAGDIMVLCDRHLITQAVTNLVKNAHESLENQVNKNGVILIEAAMVEMKPYIRVCDNGVGLPKENRHRLIEPYITTREKGTGLGLAIVKRIMEEHGGRLLLEDAPFAFAQGEGAQVTLEFAAQT